MSSRQVAAAAGSVVVMNLDQLVITSSRIAATRARNEKIALLSDLLRRLEPHEVPIGVAYLSGHLRQGRIGIGWAALRSAAGAAAGPGGPPPFHAEGHPAAPPR